VYARVKVLDFRLDCVVETRSSDAMDDNLVSDFIVLKIGCLRYGGGDDFLNGKAVGLEDREGRSIVFGNKLDVVIGGELYGSNERLLNCRVDSIVYSKVIGIVWECSAISLNDNSAVAFGQNRGRGLLILRGGRERGRGWSGSIVGPGNGMER